MGTLRFTLLVLLAATVAAIAPSARPQTQDNWLILESQENGFVLISKAIANLPSDQVRQALPRVLHITWRYQDMRNRLPDEATLQFIRRIEDTFAASLGEGSESKLVLSETGNNVRLWRFYVSESVPVASVMRKAKTDLGITVDYSLGEDPAWQKHQSTLQRVKK